MKTSYPIHDRARAATLLALFVLPLLLARVTPARAAEPLESELLSACGEIPNELRERIQELRARSISVEVLEKKLREGIAKKVPPPRIAQVLTQMAADLAWIDDNLASCVETKRGHAKPALLEFGTDVLMSGMSRPALAEVLPMLCRTDDPVATSSQIADLYFFFVNRMSAPRTSAWSFAREALRRGETESALTPLVGVLQDIQRARGSLDRPLDVAVKRLQSGASLRTIKNELQEQFLRP